MQNKKPYSSLKLYITVYVLLVISFFIIPRMIGLEHLRMIGSEYLITITDSIPMLLILPLVALCALFVGVLPLFLFFGHVWVIVLMIKALIFGIKALIVGFYEHMTKWFDETKDKDKQFVFWDYLHGAMLVTVVIIILLSALVIIVEAWFS